MLLTEIRHHPTDDLLLSLATGRLPTVQRLVLDAHLELCATCRARMAALDALGGVLLEELPVAPMREDSLARTLARLDQPAPAVASVIGNRNAEWRMPEQGCVLWSDNMVIPVGAPNVGAAFGFMDFVYEPKVAAGLTEYITYISPVDGVKKLVPAELADDPLVFPSPEFTKTCSTQESPPDAETVSAAWADVVAG